jgi:predicted ATP-grasp superfamily ATP-dependent carboligase
MAFGAARCLRETDLSFCLISTGRYLAVSSMRGCRGSEVINRAALDPADPTLATQIRTLTDTYPYAVVVPAGIEATLYLVRHSAMFPAKQMFPLADEELVRLLNSKWRFSQLLDEVGVRQPRTALLHAPSDLEAVSTRWPAIIKPVASEASLGVQVVASRSKALAALADIGNAGLLPVLLQEYIQGVDLGVSVLADKGRVRAIRLQEPQPDGSLRYRSDSEALEIAETIVSATRFHGVANIDLRRAADDSQLHVLECNPRLYATVHKSAYAGANMVELGVRMVRGEPLKEVGLADALVRQPLTVLRASTVARGRTEAPTEDKRVLRAELRDPLSSLLRTAEWRFPRLARRVRGEAPDPWEAFTSVHAVAVSAAGSYLTATPAVGRNDSERWASLDGPAGPARTVVFAETAVYDSFSMFAAALRRRGIRVVRTTAKPTDVRQRARLRLHRLVFDKVVPLLDDNRGSEQVGVDRLASLCLASTALEATEQVASALKEAHRASGPPKVGPDVDEAILYDKLEMTRLAESLGLSVPETWDSPLRVSGHGFAVKGSMGNGGNAVRLVPRANEVHGVWAEMRREHRTLFVQRLVPGPVISVGGVARQGQIVAASVYQSRPAVHDPLGPPAEILLLEQPVTMAAAARLIAALAYTGMFCIDYVGADRGEPHFIDFNPRVFGSWAAVQRSGIDLIGAYLYAWGMAESPPSQARPTRGEWVATAPFNRFLRRTPVSERNWPEQAAELIDFTKLLGWRWLLLRLIEVAAFRKRPDSHTPYSPDNRDRAPIVIGRAMESRERRVG